MRVISFLFVISFYLQVQSMEGEVCPDNFGGINVSEEVGAFGDPTSDSDSNLKNTPACQAQFDKMYDCCFRQSLGACDSRGPAKGGEAADFASSGNGTVKKLQEAVDQYLYLHNKYKIVSVACRSLLNEYPRNCGFYEQATALFDEAYKQPSCFDKEAKQAKAKADQTQAQIHRISTAGASVTKCTETNVRGQITEQCFQFDNGLQKDENVAQKDADKLGVDPVTANTCSGFVLGDGARVTSEHCRSSRGTGAPVQGEAGNSFKNPGEKGPNGRDPAAHQKGDGSLLARDEKGNFTGVTDPSKPGQDTNITKDGVFPPDSTNSRLIALDRNHPTNSCTESGSVLRCGSGVINSIHGRQVEVIGWPRQRTTGQFSDHRIPSFESRQEVINVRAGQVRVDANSGQFVYNTPTDVFGGSSGSAVRVVNGLTINGQHYPNVILGPNSYSGNNGGDLEGTPIVDFDSLPDNIKKSSVSNKKLRAGNTVMKDLE